MADDPLDIATMLAEHAGEASSTAREIALFNRLPPEKQKVVFDRLAAVAPLLSGEVRGAEAAGAIADRIGVSVRSLYRLVARIRAMGPVAALAPTAGGGRKRRSDAEATLSKAVRDGILSQVLKNPNQPIGALVAKMRDIDPEVATSTVRRHALLLRKNLDPVVDARFGRAWLLDQAAVRIPVEREGGVFWLTATFLVDVDTGLIVGRAPARGSDDAGMDALIHAFGRLPSVIDTRLRFANRMNELTWAVPDGWTRQAEAVLDRASSMRPSVSATALMGDKFRRGSKLSWIIGGAIGAVGIMIRATPDPRAVLKPQDPAPRSEAEALAVLDANIVEANSSISKWAKPPTYGKPGSSAKIRVLARQMRTLVEVFEPALSGEQQAEAQRLIGRIDDEATARVEAIG
jgi:hypothetical protein